MSVYAGVPVKAAVEGGMIVPGFYDGQSAVGESDPCFIGEFLLHTTEGQVGKMGGTPDGQFDPVDLCRSKMGILGGNVYCI